MHQQSATLHSLPECHLLTFNCCSQQQKHRCWRVRSNWRCVGVISVTNFRHSAMPCCLQGLHAKQPASGVSNGARTRIFGVAATDERITGTGTTTGDGNMTGNGNSTVDGETTSDGKTTGDGNSTVDGETTSDGKTTGDVGSVSFQVGISNRPDLKVHGGSICAFMARIMPRPRERGQSTSVANETGNVFVHGAWRFVDELTRSTSADNDGDDNTLKNFAAIFRVLIF